MRIKKLLLVMVAVATSFGAFASDGTPINIIPQPLKMEVGNGNFTIDGKTAIVYDAQLADLAGLLADYVYRPTALKLAQREGVKGGKNTILLSINPQIENEEGYTLDVNGNGVVINGKTPAGVFYGVQSLMQLLPPQIESDKLQEFALTVPFISIQDQPQFEWRGAMLDVGRYFFPKEFILRFIDMMAMYKMNKLHFHLVDDSGWRLEIKAYPLLTSVGSFAGEGAARTGGHYTQEEIKEMVAYGQLRGVEIVPELEFPAHILSGVVAYPWLSCREEQLKIPLQHYISKDLICVGKQSSIDFLAQVIKETCELFPSKYIHVGGDEAVYDYWSECPHCQKVLKEQGFTKSAELQSYLTNVVADMAAQYGRTIVGWDEILERGEVHKPVVSMIWRDMNGLDHVLNSKHSAILAPADFTYYDFPESRLPGEIKAATWKSPISVEKTYNFLPEKLENQPKVIGIEACMWSDQFIHGTVLQEISLLNENRSEKYIEYLMLPRMLALSEVCWTPFALRNFENFNNKLAKHYKRLDYAGFNYRIPTPDIKSTKTEDGYLVEISTPVEGAQIYYTTNGDQPTTYDKLYTEPVKATQLSDVRALAAVSKTHHSVPTFFEEDYSAYKQYGSFIKKFQHASLKDGETVTLEADLTGRISADGEYEITLAPLTEGVNVKLTELTVLKRGEQTAQADFNTTLTSPQPATVKVTISQWQAGTPYNVKIAAQAQGNKGNFALFIKKLN